MAETIQTKFDDAVQTIRDTIKIYQDVEQDLLDENAKLRDIASDMLGVISDMQVAFDASVVRDGTEMDAEHFIDRLRELGVKPIQIDTKEER